jgi:hypothetical protein
VHALSSGQINTTQRMNLLSEFVTAYGLPIVVSALAAGLATPDQDVPDREATPDPVQLDRT